jgi:ATP-binding cassette, subfamily B, bacterial
MKTSNTRQTIDLFWCYTRRYPVSFALGSGGAALAVIVQEIIPPFIVSRTFGRLQYAYAHHTTLRFANFVPYLLAFTVAMLCGAVLWRLQSYCVWTFEERVRRDLANDIYAHLQAQSQRFHADRFAGAIVSQVNKFIGAYERLMDELIWNIIPGLVALIVSVGVLLFVSYKYALVLSVVIMVYVVVMSRRVIRQMPYNVVEAASESDQTAALADAIANMGTIRAFAHEDYEQKRFGDATNHVYQAMHKLSVEVFKTEAVSHVQTNGFQVLAFLFGLVATTMYGVNVSVLYLILSYTQAIVGRLWQFSRVMRNVNRSFGDATEMTDILQIRPEVQDPVQPHRAHIARGEVAFRDVTFYYPENQQQPLFEHLDFKIKPGEKVGLVGPSGGGKTTITKLLLRFMDISDGAITLDGHDIGQLRQSTVRSHIAYVAQEPILFHRSLMDNIRYGRLDASDKEVKAIAKLAHAHDFIEDLPKGYATMVGERGVKLSGGQRQRVAIARAMLKNAPILVLDEATSALDSESEVLIQDALWKLMEGRTAIVIAHRLSTIQKMDRIIVLENGNIVEQGSHKELLHVNGTYARLWAHQSGGFIEE